MSHPAVIFDLDGTLVDTAEDLGIALQYTLRQAGVKPCSLESARRWVGHGALALLRHGFAAQGQTPTEDELAKHCDTFLAFYSEHLSEHSRAYPHAVSTLKTLQAQGYVLGVCTNKPHDFAVRLLDALDVRKHFACVCGYAGDGVRKPDKELLLRVLQRMDVEATRASVMVGDSLADAQAAQGCGLRFVAVSFGYGYDSLMGGGAGGAENNSDVAIDVTLDDLAALPPWLQKDSSTPPPP
ncbi:MAG: HAD-IIIA family hydrolase [Alphaproteobacteria bacterium GM202ARS2]|nr:HAD-IIIA family hydrolase [Alphaproteobacteria bacterium GM202ARS2]